MNEFKIKECAKLLFFTLAFLIHSTQKNMKQNFKTYFHIRGLLNV